MAYSRIYNIPWNIDNLHIQTMLKGARKATPEALKLSKCLPLLIEDIITIRSHLNLALPLDAAMFACLTMMFFTAACLGEFTLKNLSCFDA